MCGAIVNRRSIRAASAALPRGRASAAGSSSGGRTGRPMPNPGIAALPQASSGSSARRPAARASARSAATSGSSASTPDPDACVGLGRVGEVRERHRPPDDGHRVARGESRLAIAPPSTRPSREPAKQGPAALIDVRPRCGPHRQQRGDRGLAVDLRRRDGAARPQREPGRLVAERSGPIVEADRGVPACAAREHPHVARLVDDAKPDRALLDHVVGVAEIVVAALDRRAVVDARRALQWRDQHHLRRLDPPAHAHLTGRQRRDPRRAGVADARRRPVAAHPADEQPEARDDARDERGCDRGSDPSMDASYGTGAGRFSSSGVRGGSTGPAASPRAPRTRSATAARSRSPGIASRARNSPPMTMSTSPAAIGPRPLTSSPPRDPG